MQVLEVLLLLAAMLAALVGLFSLSQATAGVGGIAAACFLAILARMAQASFHTSELTKMIDAAGRQAKTQTASLEGEGSTQSGRDSRSTAPVA